MWKAVQGEEWTGGRVRGINSKSISGLLKFLICENIKVIEKYYETGVLLIKVCFAFAGFQFNFKMSLKVKGNAS